MALLMTASFLYALNFGLLLPVVPVIVADASGGAAGLVNTTLLVATVITQWMSPTLLQYATRGRLFLIGVVLMSLPCIAYAPEDASTWSIFVASGLRGAGFGLVTVVSSALVIELAPASRRGATLGAFGLATSIPGIFGPSLGLWLLNEYSSVEPAAAGLGAGILAVCILLLVRVTRAGGTLSRRESVPQRALLDMLADRHLRAYAIAFTLISVAWGGTTALLALALPPGGLSSAAAFLFVSGLLRAVGRWAAGWWVDRGVDPVGASPPVVAVTALGLALIAIDTSAISVIISATVYGFGLGVLQTMLFLAIVRRNMHGHSAASALWAGSLDAGGVLGTSCLAGVAVIAGYGAVLWSMPVIMLMAIPLLLGRRSEQATATPCGQRAVRQPEPRGESHRNNPDCS